MTLQAIKQSIKFESPACVGPEKNYKERNYAAKIRIQTEWERSVCGKNLQFAAGKENVDLRIGQSSGNTSVFFVCLAKREPARAYKEHYQYPAGKNFKIVRRKNMNKTKLVKKWLLKKKSITTFQAFELFGATRLSAIIYSLRKSGMPIKAESVKIKDRYGHTCIIAKYKLSKGVKK